MAISTLPTIVKSFYGDPAGAPKKHTPVVATLIGPTQATGGAVYRQVKVYTDNSGNWSIPLLPNALFGSGNTSYYSIRVGALEEYKVRVPASANIVSVETILITSPPPVISSYFVGDVIISGNLIVQGPIRVSENLTFTGGVTVQQNIQPGQIPLWYNGIDITGNLTVAGNIICLGSIEADNYPGAIV